MAVTCSAHSMLCVFCILFLFSTYFAAKNVFAFSCDTINSIKGSMKVRSVIIKQLNMNTK